MWAKSSWCLGQRRRTRAGAGRPSGPGKRSWEATFCWPPDPCISSSIRIALSLLPPKVSSDDCSSSLFFLFSQGCPPPSFLPSKEVGK